MGDIVVTYETLFELLRREKGRGELQELDADFFSSVIAYIAEKKTLLTDKPSEFGEDRMKIERQLLNIRKVVRELYEKREKKIVDLALNVSRAGVDTSDTSFLPEEKVFFQGLMDVLDGARVEVLQRVLDAHELPQKEKEKMEPPSDHIQVKFTQKTEQFAGEDMQLYGPFEKGKIESFPNTLAKMLVARGCAEILEESS